MPSLKPNAHLQSLEMMRAAAACLIVCYHACLFAERILGATPLLGWYHGLQLGVDSFFVLSGFILFWRHEQDLGHPQRAGRYLRRRLIRILPLLWLATLSKQALLVWNGEALNMTRLVASLLLWPAKPQDPLITNAWSLSHELLFYLLLLMGIILSRQVFALLGLLWLGAVLVASATNLHPQGVLGMLCDNHNLAFAAGVGAAMLLRRQALTRWQRSGCWLVAGIALSAALVRFDASGGMDQNLAVRLLAAGGFALLIAAAASADAGHWMAPRSLLLVGKASYSIYLGHSLILLPLVREWNRVFKPSPSASTTLLVLPCAVISILLCLLLWRFVEEPLLRRLRAGRQTRPSA